MESGVEYDLYAMLSGVVDCWKAFLTEGGVTLREDPGKREAEVRSEKRSSCCSLIAFSMLPLGQ